MGSNSDNFGLGLSLVVKTGAKNGVWVTFKAPRTPEYYGNPDILVSKFRHGCEDQFGTPTDPVGQGVWPQEGKEWKNFCESGILGGAFWVTFLSAAAKYVNALREG